MARCGVAVRVVRVALGRVALPVACSGRCGACVALWCV